MRAVALDVGDPASIARLAKWVEREYGRLQVMVNNVSILYYPLQHASSARFGQLQKATTSNLYDPWRMSQACRRGR